MLDNIPTDIPEEEGYTEDEITKVAEDTLKDIPPPEMEPYKISFSNYKEDKCTIQGMDGKSAQIVTKIIKHIGLNFKSQDFFSLNKLDSRMQIKQVFNSRPYSEYYKNLPYEIQTGEEVKEIVYDDDRTSNKVNLRIFYYTLSDIFYMLAVTAGVHENLDHKIYKPKWDKKKYFRR